MYEPVISLRVETEAKTDQEALEAALRKLAEEDSTFQWRTDSESNKTTIWGMGDLHLEIVVDRLQREFHTRATFGQPQVIYRKQQMVLEPIMQLEVTMPREFLGKVGNDICTKRGRISVLTDGDTMAVIKAKVPLANFLGYAGTLRSMTHGRASHTMQFDCYK